MRALVTGASGFVGSHVVDALVAGGCATRGLVRDSAKTASVRGAGAEPAVGDLMDLDSMRRAVRGMDVVVHCAARVTDWGPWREFEAATVLGTENVLRAATDAGVGRFVHVSSVVVYDDRYTRRHRVVTEEAPQGDAGDRAYGHYARAKVLAERAAWAFHRAQRLAVTVLRPAWVYGPRDRTILPRLIGYLRDPRARWVGKRDPVVDPIYVTDVAACVLAAARCAGASGRAYNVAPDREVRLREFLGALCAAMGLPAPSRSIPYALVAALTRICEGWSRLVRRAEPPVLTSAGLASFTVDQHNDPARAIHELGWRPLVALTEGARRTAEWLHEGACEQAA